MLQDHRLGYLITKKICYQQFDNIQSAVREVNFGKSCLLILSFFQSQLVTSFRIFETGIKKGSGVIKGATVNKAYSRINVEYT